MTPKKCNTCQIAAHGEGWNMSHVPYDSLKMVTESTEYSKGTTICILYLQGFVILLLHPSLVVCVLPCSVHVTGLVHTNEPNMLSCLEASHMTSLVSLDDNLSREASFRHEHYCRQDRIGSYACMGSHIGVECIVHKNKGQNYTAHSDMHAILQYQIFNK